MSAMQTWRQAPIAPQELEAIGLGEHAQRRSPAGRTGFLRTNAVTIRAKSTALASGRRRRREASSGLKTIGGRLARAAIPRELIAELLTLTKLIQSGALDGRDMHEDVPAAVVGLDEAVTLGAIVPLDGTSAHDETFQK
jgi:hypothetical protein